MLAHRLNFFPHVEVTMKKLLFIAFLAICIQAYISARAHWYRWAPQDPDAGILMYGRPGCPLCDELRSSLEENRIPYDFINIDEDRLANEEMWRLVWETKGRNFKRVNLPVVYISDKVLISPSFSDLSEVYGTRKWALEAF